MWTPTPPLSGWRTPRSGLVRVCVYSLLLYGPARLASWARLGAPHLSCGCFILLLCLAPSRLGLPLLCPFVCLSFFFYFSLPPGDLLLLLVSSPSVLGVGAPCPPLPSPRFFSLVSFLSAGFVWCLFPSTLLFLFLPPLSFFFFPLFLPPPLVFFVGRLLLGSACAPFFFFFFWRVVLWCWAAACCAVSLVIPSYCFILVCGAVCCAVSLGAVLRRVSADLCRVGCFARLVPLLAVWCPWALSVALWSCAFRHCVFWFSPALCALCCVCLAVVCRCVLLFAAVLCAVCVCCVCPGVSCCAFPVLSPLCGVVRCCAVGLALCCSCGVRCLRCLVLWRVALCCAVSCGVLWRGAGSGCPRLSSGRVFQCQSPCLAAWPAPAVGSVCCCALIPCVVFCGAVLLCGAVLSCSAVLLQCCLCLLFLLLCPVVLCCLVVPGCWAVLCVVLCCVRLSNFENIKNEN